MPKRQTREQPTNGSLSGTPLGLLASLFERDLKSFARYDTHAYGVDNFDETASLTIITAEFEYTFEVHNIEPAQLVAFWCPRRSIPGIPSKARQILHGGPCAEATWVKILSAIVSRELVARAPQF